MTLELLVRDKSLKPKEKAEMISRRLLEGTLSTAELVAFAEQAKDPEKATCIEAMEFATKQNPGIADETLFSFVTKSLAEKAPRVKWESAKVIGNIAPCFPNKLNKAIVNLLANTEHKGTVVRWAAAFALGEILQMKTKHNKELLPAVEAIYNREENNGVRRKYSDALKKTMK